MSGCSTTSENGTAADARLVFCLGPAQRGNLAAAAAALRLATPATGTGQLIGRDHRPITVSDWQRQDPAGFDRACQALWAARQPGATASSGNSFLATLDVLLPLIAGTVLGLLTSAYRDLVVRRRDQATELQVTTELFIRTADGFVRAWSEVGNRGDPAPLREAHWKLITVLRTVSLHHPRWSAVSRTRELVDGPPLGDALLHGWERLDHAQRVRRATEVRELWDELSRATDRISVALQRPVWLRPTPDPLPDAATAVGAP